MPYKLQEERRWAKIEQELRPHYDATALSLMKNMYMTGYTHGAIDTIEAHKTKHNYVESTTISTLRKLFQTIRNLNKGRGGDSAQPTGDSADGGAEPKHS